jgi:hypothetical protein
MTDITEEFKKFKVKKSNETTNKKIFDFFISYL